MAWGSVPEVNSRVDDDFRICASKYHRKRENYNLNIELPSLPRIEFKQSRRNVISQTEFS